MRYGESTTIYFPVYQPDGTPATLPSIAVMLSAEIAKDGGSFAATTNSIQFVSTGLYKLVLTASEMSCDTFVIRFDTSHFTGDFMSPIVGDTTRDVDLTGVISALDTVRGLAGHFTVTTNTLTIYNDDGTANGTFTLTRNGEGEITAIEPVVSNNQQ